MHILLKKKKDMDKIKIQKLNFFSILKKKVSNNFIIYFDNQKIHL